MEPIIRITREPLDADAVAELERAVEDPSVGGMVTFQGVVRDHNKGKRIRYLEYEAYPEMAEREMANIAAEVTRRWSTDRVAIAHRVGRLEIGECSVVVVVACAHLDRADAACLTSQGDRLQRTRPRGCLPRLGAGTSVETRLDRRVHAR